MWTREKIVELLQTRDDAVERGILRIYQLQTEDEKRSGSTKHSNGVGFNGADASYGTYLAQWLSKGKRYCESRQECCIAHGAPNWGSLFA